MGFAKVVIACLAVQFCVLDANASNVCTKPEYAELVHALENFPPAKSFCSSRFPIKPVKKTTTIISTVYTTTDTQTTTMSTCPPDDQNNIKRMPVAAPTFEKRAATERPNNPTPESPAAQLSQLKKEPASYIKTVCSCIERPAPTVTSSTTSITSEATTTTVCATPTPTDPICSDFSQCGNPIGCSSGEDCFCVKGTSGVISCVADYGCSDCTTDAGCTDRPGGVCEIGSCCPAGACFYADNSCENPAKRGVFAGGVGGKRTNSFMLY